MIFRRIAPGGRLACSSLVRSRPVDALSREIIELEEEADFFYHVQQDCYTLGRYWSQVPGVVEEHDNAERRMREIRERIDALLGMMRAG